LLLAFEWILAADLATPLNPSFFRIFVFRIFGLGYPLWLSRPLPRTIAPMARLSDIPQGLNRSVGLIPFCYRVWDEVSKDNLLVWGIRPGRIPWLFANFPVLHFSCSRCSITLPGPGHRRDEEGNRQGDGGPVSPVAAHSALWKDNRRKSGQHDPPTATCAGPCSTWACCWRSGLASGGTSMTMASLGSLLRSWTRGPFVDPAPPGRNPVDPLSLASCCLAVVCLAARGVDVQGMDCERRG